MSPELALVREDEGQSPAKAWGCSPQALRGHPPRATPAHVMGGLALVRDDARPGRIKPRQATLRRKISDFVSVYPRAPFYHIMYQGYSLHIK